MRKLIVCTNESTKDDLRKMNKENLKQINEKIEESNKELDVYKRQVQVRGITLHLIVF